MGGPAKVEGKAIEMLRRGARTGARRALRAQAVSSRSRKPRACQRPVQRLYCDLTGEDAGADAGASVSFAEPLDRRILDMSDPSYGLILRPR